jgi:hypothetical protein
MNKINIKKHEDKINFINNYNIHPIIVERCFKELEKKYNIILEDEIKEGIILSLKDYFISRYYFDKPSGMPSVLSDELWHTFIIYTTEYFSFCNELDGYIHHAPEDIKPVKSNNVKKNKESRVLSKLRTYVACCQIENIDPFTTNELPLLFNIDLCVDFEEGKFHSIEDLQIDLKTYHHML